MKARRRYTSEFKQQAVDLVENGRPVPEVAMDLEIEEGTADELRRLRAENAQLKSENIILKKSGCDSRNRTSAENHEMITRIVENTSESIRKTCEVLGVARSSFYEARTPSARRTLKGQTFSPKSLLKCS